MFWRGGSGLEFRRMWSVRKDDDTKGEIIEKLQLSEKLDVSQKAAVLKRAELLRKNALLYNFKACCMSNSSQTWEKSKFYYIRIDKIRTKWFDETLQLFCKNTRQSELEFADTCTAFRMAQTKITLMKTIHRFCILKITEISLTSKQFIKLIMSGAFLKTLVLCDSEIVGPKLTFACLRTLPLQEFVIFEREINPTRYTRNIDYYRTMLENLDQCKFTDTLGYILFENTDLQAHESLTLEQTFRNLKVKFITK
ncbi:unnamed protein product [Moneuplotes crassus]|uniref:Uncharacterized protein n=1 Tax=Euplotes crassus TaxID=5936 RepID=A0AAD1XPX0_EUPCR|nr:unnamed protein product [Moneuplotes crassus]